jgi:hypothetical protein
MPKSVRILVLEDSDDLSADFETGTTPSDLANEKSVEKAKTENIPWITDQELDVFNLREPLSLWSTKLEAYLVEKNANHPASFLTAQLDVCYNLQDDPGNSTRPGFDLILPHLERAKTHSDQATYWARLRDTNDRSNVVWIACPSIQDNNSPYAYPTVFYFSVQLAAKSLVTSTSSPSEKVRVRTHITTYHTEDCKIQTFHIFPPLSNIKVEETCSRKRKAEPSSDTS